MLLYALTPVSVSSQQNKDDAISILSIRVDKAKPEIKSGKWVAGKTAASSVQTFDGRGNRVESIVYNEGGNIYLKYSAKYDAADLKTEDVYFDEKGVVRRKTIYQYDASKKLIGMLYFDSKDTAKWEAAVRYKAGRIDELITYGLMGVVKGRTVYTYHDDSRKLEARHYDYAGFSGGEIKTFDDNGLIKENISYDLEESDGSRTLYKHDKNGYVTEMVLHIGGGSVTWKYTYEFDAHGQWVTRIITPTNDGANGTNAQPIDITHRTITYGARKGKPESSKSQSPAQLVESDMYNSMMYGYLRKRNIQSSKFSEFHLKGQAKVFVMINELGKIILTIPFGRITSSAEKVSAEKVKEIMGDMIKDWKYTPATLDGEPIMVTGQVNLNFRSR